MSESNKEKHHVLDVKGLSCPYPQYLVLKTMEKLSLGERLEVILDNPPSYKLIQEAAKKKGYKIIVAEQIHEGLWRIILEK
ncbi:MAG: sulfurtransferase TusA family protein [Thermoprotei archaeon]